ncbi:MAG TPA: NAD-dependent epimerase/dehydratase family protein [Acidobacteriaceae bacterium]|nr:NAD-dependent epimerase/dehydratase family protein [Acidobacteriaceae bacterium]
MSIVLVTGGTGFVGSHLVAELLKQDCKVRTTVRDLDRRSLLAATLERSGVTNRQNLEIYAADLESDAGWATAIDGCEFVHHVASPFPSDPPRDENVIIRPAVEGTKRVLRFSRMMGVRRVVMTSSFVAVGFGHPPSNGREFTEADWTDISVPLPPYIKGKTLAEQAAWKFIREEGSGMEFTTIIPAGIFGPVLGTDYAASIMLIKLMLDGKMPGLPRIYFGVVDVRDVVDIHLRAMTNPRAAGERFIAVSGAPMSMLQVAQTIRARLGTAAKKVPRKQLPDWLMRIAAFFNPKAKQVLPLLGKCPASSNQKARTVLGWSPRLGEEAVIASAESLLKLTG